jgi:DNA-binding GntR family transcriptional regulator
MATRSTAIARNTTAQIVAGKLRDEIQEGVLGPGTRLRQNEIAARFGVSTTPVREAFAQLAVEGLVRIDPHRGAVVFHPTLEDLVEYYEIREALETLAVSNAAEAMTPALAKELTDHIDRMRRTKNPRRWLQLNDEFHLKLYACAGRPRLSALIANLRDASNPYIYMFVADTKPIDEANDEHEAIVAACVAGDHEAAERAIRDHLRHTAQALAEQLPQDHPAD